MSPGWLISWFIKVDLLMPFHEAREPNREKVQYVTFHSVTVHTVIKQRRQSPKNFSLLCNRSRRRRRADEYSHFSNDWNPQHCTGMLIQSRDKHTANTMLLHAHSMNFSITWNQRSCVKKCVFLLHKSALSHQNRFICYPAGFSSAVWWIWHHVRVTLLSFKMNEMSCHVFDSSDKIMVICGTEE